MGEPCAYCHGVRLVGWSGAGPILCPTCSRGRDAFTVVTQAWREARQENARLREALEEADEALRHVAGHGFEHPDHHADDCPGDCDDHTTAWIVETAIGKARAALHPEPEEKGT